MNTTNDSAIVRWYVMRAYKSEKLAEEVLAERSGLKFFVPKHYVMRTFHGRKAKILVPVIPSLVFVHASKESILNFKKIYNFLQFVMWEKSTGKECLVVPDNQMEDFIKVSSAQEDTTTYFKPEEINISRGTRVRIHGGRFDGVKGVFMQVKGKRNRRLVVMLEGIMAVVAEVDPDLVEVL